jgi:hypothetical protein
MDGGKDGKRYTWIVTRDSILGDSSETVGKIGPSGSTNRASFDSVIIHGEHFRMLTEAGVAKFSGYILGHFGGREPLDDYGSQNGCAVIEFEQDGSWRSLEEFQGRVRSGKKD